MITPIKISPFARRSSGGDLTLQTLFNDYSGHNQWAAQNSTVVGTTTTWIDYAASHNLSNPAAGNQPTTTNPDSDFNNKKSATFATDDYLIKNTANYGAGQSSGSIWAVIKTPSSFDDFNVIFAACDATSNLQKFMVYIDVSGELRILINDGTLNNLIRTTSALTVSTTYIIQVRSNGSTTSVFINGLEWVVAASIGLNNGNWFTFANTGSTLDNLSIGGRINTLNYYFNGKIAFVANYPILTTPQQADMFNRLNAYYDVY